jgi:hypothetical protein
MTRTARTITVVLASLVALALFAAGASAQGSTTPSAWLARLPSVLSALPHSEGDVQRVLASQLPPGVRYVAHPTSSYPCTLASGQRGMCPAISFAIELDRPLPARTVARALGLRDPRIYSADVHMRSWSIHETGTRETYRTGFMPTYGAWTVRAMTERPRGPLPSEHIGPSPAFRLGARDRVARIVISLDLSQPHDGVPPRAVR